MQVGLDLAQFDEGHKFVQHNLGTKQAAGGFGFVPGDVEHEHQRLEQGAEERLEAQAVQPLAYASGEGHPPIGSRVGDAGADAAEQAIGQRHQRDKG